MRRDLFRVRLTVRVLPRASVAGDARAQKQGAEALAVLRLSGYFDRVYGAGHMGADLAKPQIEAFELILGKKNADIDPTRTAFFEDSVKNLAAAKTLGMTTVLVQARS